MPTSRVVLSAMAWSLSGLATFVDGGDAAVSVEVEEPPGDVALPRPVHGKAWPLGPHVLASCPRTSHCGPTAAARSARPCVQSWAHKRWPPGSQPSARSLTRGVEPADMNAELVEINGGPGRESHVAVPGRKSWWTASLSGNGNRCSNWPCVASTCGGSPLPSASVQCRSSALSRSWSLSRPPFHADSCVNASHTLRPALINKVCGLSAGTTGVGSFWEPQVVRRRHACQLDAAQCATERTEGMGDVSRQVIRDGPLPPHVHGHVRRSRDFEPLATQMRYRIAPGAGPDLFFELIRLHRPLPHRVFTHVTLHNLILTCAINQTKRK